MMRRPAAATLTPYFLLAVACAGVFLAALDQTVVVTALPRMMQDLELPVTELDRASWIVTGYLLGYTVALPLTGRIADVYGYGRAYAGAVLVFAAGSALVALAPGLGWVVGARIFQAIGGGALVPVTMAMAGHLFPPGRRGLGLGAIGAVAEAGGVLGPLYGGLLLQALDWEWIFWINLPAGAVILALVLLGIRRRKGTASAVPPRSAGVDYVGGLLIAGSLALLALGLTRQGGEPWPPALMALLFLGAASLFTAFLLREIRVSPPLINLRLFRSLTLSSANATHFLVGWGLIMAMVLVPLMTDTVLGRSPLEGGLRLMRLTAAIPVGALIGGFLVSRTGYRAPTALGLGLCAASFYLLSRWGLDVTDPGMTRDLVIGGLGFGLVIAPIGSAALDSAKRDEQGTAAALVTVTRMVGMMVGLAALTWWGMGRFTGMAGDISVLPLPGESGAATEARVKAELTGASLSLFKDLFLAAMTVCLIALVPVVGMGGGRGASRANRKHPARNRELSPETLTPSIPRSLGEGAGEERRAGGHPQPPI